MSQEVSIQQAYEWVKTGHWNLSQFRAWCEAVHNPKPVDEIGEVNSWAGDVDRQGGSFTDAEINSRLTGW